MGARIAAMAHHPNDGNHAGTNLPTHLAPSRSVPLPYPSPNEYNPLTPSRSYSRDFLLTLCPDTARWHRDTSAFADRTLRLPFPFSTRHVPYPVRLFRPTVAFV